MRWRAAGALLMMMKEGRSPMAAKQGKPRVLHRCVADQYSASNERIIEFSFPGGTGGLISLRDRGPDHDPASQRGYVEVYRTEGQVEVSAPKRSYWAAYAGSSLVNEITLHRTRRAAIEWVIDSLGVDVLGRVDRLENDDDGEDEDGALGRVLDRLDDDELEDVVKQYTDESTDDYRINEVETP